MKEDNGIVNLPIEYIEREELLAREQVSERYTNEMPKMNEARLEYERAQAAYLLEKQRAEDIRNQDDFEYQQIMRDAKAAFRPQKEAYSKIEQEFNPLEEAVSRNKEVRPVVIDVSQCAEELRSKTNGAPASENSKKMVDHLAQLIAQDPQIALDKFVDQIGENFTAIEKKTIKLALQSDFDKLVEHSHKSSLRNNTNILKDNIFVAKDNAKLFANRIGNLIDQMANPEYKVADQDFEKLGHQSRYLEGLQNKMLEALANPIRERLAKSKNDVSIVPDHSFQEMKIESRKPSAGRVSDDLGDESARKEAPPAFDPNYKMTPSAGSLRESLSSAETKQASPLMMQAASEKTFKAR